MFKQLETCQPGNYLPVTGSSGRELKPLQGENKEHISFLSFLFISLPLSGYFFVFPLTSLCTFSHYFSVQTNRGQNLSICGLQIEAVFFILITFLLLVSCVLTRPRPELCFCVGSMWDLHHNQKRLWMQRSNVRRNLMCTSRKMSLVIRSTQPVTILIGPMCTAHSSWALRDTFPQSEEVGKNTRRTNKFTPGGKLTKVRTQEGKKSQHLCVSVNYHMG